MEKLRIGVLGCAEIARRKVIPAILQSDFFHLHCVSSRSESKAKDFSLLFDCRYVVGYEELIEMNDLDVIYMPLPISLHKHWAIKALNANKHLLIEKSFASSLEEVTYIIEVARSKNLLVLENFMFEHHKQISAIKNQFNKIGTIRVLRSSFGFPPFDDKNNIRYDKELSGGSLYDAGAYTVKIAGSLLEGNLKLLSGSLLMDKELQVDVSGGVLLTDSKGTIIQLAFGFENFYQCSLELWGEKGRLITNRVFTAGEELYTQIFIETTEGQEVITIEPDNHFVNILNFFGKTVFNGNFEAEYVKILDQARLLDVIRNKSEKIYK
jgi:NDP-hexose-3-ketoreductase